MCTMRQVGQLQQKLKVAEAAADAAGKRAEQEAEFRVDVAQVRLRILDALQQHSFLSCWAEAHPAVAPPVPGTSGEAAG